MRETIKHTDDELEEMFDEYGLGITVEDLVFTQDTLDNFREAREIWNKPGRVEEDEADHLVIRDAQAAAGQPRRDVVIIDFNTCRAVATL